MKLSYPGEDTRSEHTSEQGDRSTIEPTKLRTLLHPPLSLLPFI